MTGYAGGSHYTQNGGAAEYVCLPSDPVQHAHFQQLDHGGDMYGAEYQGGSLADNNVPCSVCRVPAHTTVIMIPARDTCYTGWTLQYHGMLSSGHSTDKSANQFVCLDAAPQIVAGGHNNEDGKLFYTVIGHCGSLPCPPYTEGSELSCVVCAK